MDSLIILLVLAAVGFGFYFYVYNGMTSSGGMPTTIPMNSYQEGYSTGQVEAMELKKGGGSKGVSAPSAQSVEEMTPIHKTTSNSADYLFDPHGSIMDTGGLGGSYNAGSVTFYPINGRF